MQALLTPEQFAARVVGMPWRKWHADFDGADCFGCIVLWYRHVVGVDLGEVPQTDIATGFSRAAGWVECPPAAGSTCWMAWRDGAPSHCGVLLTADTVLHSQESDQAPPGSVRVTRLSILERVYGPLTFYRYDPC
ncbi:hypothetical protein GN316_06730 [Xylophilus sp. Kf1]|nr:hypothetical protein [Xylophilus sp. Kf1]